jgi:beta-xylosidase
MRYTKFILFIIVTLFGFSCNNKQTTTVETIETYHNPVIAGDFPDPTVIRVGDTYYAATSSSEWALPYRLFQSKDLINWEYIGPLL